MRLVAGAAPAAGNVYCRHCSSVRLGLKTSRGPDALAIARVTITWWPPPTIKGSPPPTAATISRLSR